MKLSILKKAMPCTWLLSNAYEFGNTEFTDIKKAALSCFFYVYYLPYSLFCSFFRANKASLLNEARLKLGATVKASSKIAAAASRLVSWFSWNLTNPFRYKKKQP